MGNNFNLNYKSRMNKRVYLIVFTLLSLISCSTEENDSVGNENNEVVGKWFYVSEKFDGEEILSSACDFQQYYEFYSDGTIKIKFLDQPPCDFTILNGNYNIVDDRLELTKLEGSDEINYSMRISEKTSSRMVLELEDDGEFYSLELKKS